MDRLLKQLLYNSPDAILISDQEGIIHFWNSGAEQIFDYTAAEVEGQSLDLIIPEDLRGHHWEGYWRMMASGETKYKTGLLSAPGVRKNGTSVLLELSIVLVHDESRGVKGGLSIMRDVTERSKKVTD